jgi:hypothetical protein
MPSQSAFAATPSLLGQRQRPAWFDSAIKTVLAGLDVVMAAGGPRELEQATAELLGAELHRILTEEDMGMWFGWWFEELTKATATRVRDELGNQDGAWQAPWRLLHGLTSIGSPAQRSTAHTEISRLTKQLRGAAAIPEQPEWLRHLSQIEATGDVWEMRDVYGSRIAMIASFSYPNGMDPSVFLFDIDACGFVSLAGAGVFDDVQQAAIAWRTQLGDTATDAPPPNPVRTAERLLCLVHCKLDEDILRGDESRTLLDNWFRANRRRHDLADALRKRGMRLPEETSLYHDLDIDPMVDAFTDWYLQHHEIQPDPDAVGALAEEWMERTLPDTSHAPSPHRVEFHLALINDWKPDHPTTVAAKALLPEWVRWHGEQAGLPEHFIDRAIAVATGHPRPASDCGAAAAW